MTRLPSAHRGTFDFFLDIGCFQDLDAGIAPVPGARNLCAGQPRGHRAAAEFGPSRWRRLPEAHRQQEVETAFAGWQMLAVELADTAGLGWPMNKTAPRWYWLRRQTLERHCPVSRRQADARRGRSPTRAE